MRKSTLVLLSRLAIACAFLAVAATSAMAAPIGVTYTVSGSAGAWMLDFSLTNNINSGQVVYFFGIVAPTQDITNLPTGWTNCANGCTTTTFNFSGAGGPNITFNDIFHAGALSADTIPFGNTLSGFDVEINSVAPPTSIQWFVAGADITPNGTSPYLGGGEMKYGPASFCTANGYANCTQEDEENPVFIERTTASGTPTPEPSSLLLLGTGLLGFVPLIRRRA